MTDQEPGVDESTAEVSLGERLSRVFVAKPSTPPAPALGSEGPPSSAGLVAVVVLDGPGDSDNAVRVCRRLAAQGFASTTSKLHFHESSAVPRIAQDIAQTAKETLATEVAALVAFARATHGTTPAHVAVMGFGLGGYAAFLAACRADIAVAIIVYGRAIASIRPAIEAELGSWTQAAAPVRCILGATDASVDVAEVGVIEGRLAFYRVPHDIVVYPRAGDGFLDESATTYRASAAQDAWTRMVEWLRSAKRSRRQRRTFPP